jgi:hypothetical protein
LLRLKAIGGVWNKIKRDKKICARHRCCIAISIGERRLSFELKYNEKNIGNYFFEVVGKKQRYKA